MHNTHYIPILKGREGEYGALKQLDKASREKLTPLIEIPPVPWDFENKRPSKTLDAHLEKVCTKIAKSWGVAYTLFLETLWLSDSENMESGLHPLTHLLNEGRKLGIKARPVFGFMRADDHLRACREANAQDKNGLCLRIQREDFTDHKDFARGIGDLLREVQTPMQKIDLVLDLRSISAKAGNVAEDDLVKLIASLPALDQWRSFTVAGTAFPENLAGLPASDCSKVTRSEWDLWKEVRSKLSKNTRKPAFGDYAISHPEMSEVDPRIMKPSASVRYTYRNYWLIMKARNLKDHGFKQFHALSSQLVKRTEYAGAGFSWGDEYIGECGKQKVGPGNLTTWRKVGTSHHLAVVLSQLASFV